VDARRRPRGPPHDSCRCSVAEKHAALGRIARLTWPSPLFVSHRPILTGVDGRPRLAEVFPHHGSGTTPASINTRLFRALPDAAVLRDRTKVSGSSRNGQPPEQPSDNCLAFGLPFQRQMGRPQPRSSNLLPGPHLVSQAPCCESLARNFRLSPADRKCCRQTMHRAAVLAAQFGPKLIGTDTGVGGARTVQTAGPPRRRCDFISIRHPAARCFSLYLRERVARRCGQAKRAA
jgi:hypothetical protein